MALVLIRCLLVLTCAAATALFQPIASESLAAPAHVLANLLLGAALGGSGLLIEWIVRAAPPRTVAGALIGLLAGAGIAAVLSQALPRQEAISGWALAPEPVRAIVFLLLSLVGLLVGAQKGGEFRLDRLLARFRSSEDQRPHKILDTSVIIDGRVADVCETGFLDGILVVPQFVLRELQAVADSSDSLKRNRGRKGLDILQRVKKMGGITVLMPDTDFPQVREVDQKLIELALRMGAKIVTNDFNLNKVAQLRGIEVLNINELANALRPVVLPGETMKVFVLKEGKEPNQGVAYLDDGTMVVIDNARSHLGETVEIVVTSVLQTTAGKMFFGRCVGDLDRPQIRRHPRSERDRKEEGDPSEESSA